MADGNTGPGVGPRLLIMFYAAAVVVLGLYPMRHSFKGANNYLQRVSSQFKKEHPAWFSWIPREDPSKGAAKSASLVEVGGSPAKSGKDLDKLTKKDKQELNQLITKLSK